jgi:pyridoxine 5-phosphate synthase
MLKLGVNIDHIATLREARYRGRGRGEPDPVAAALACEAAGAHGITAHLREDRRHIQDRDVWKLREVIKTRLNLEMANVPEIAAIALKLKPDIVCVVPERRLEVTTEGGLDVVANEKTLTETRRRMNDGGIEVSLFIAPDPEQIEAAARTGAQFIELHTGAFAESVAEQPSAGSHAPHQIPDQESPPSPRDEGAGRGQGRGVSEQSGAGASSPRSSSPLREGEGAEHGTPPHLSELHRLIAGAKQAHGLGLKVNAGHGLNYQNLPLLHRVPHLVELNIGHSIVSRAVMVGIGSAVEEMLRLMENYRG